MNIELYDREVFGILILYIYTKKKTKKKPVVF